MAINVIFKLFPKNGQLYDTGKFFMLHKCHPGMRGDPRMRYAQEHEITRLTLKRLAIISIYN